ncbi:MAG: type II toxin-antitoxin system VapC family toxin [Phycisphaerales bacterium]|nr:type II toxin-antitoxin system VapC family toxin [Phycisphaerales bacterium]
MKLVVDASVAVTATMTPWGFTRFNRFEMIAPSLMLAEALSVIHEMCWRSEVSIQQAKRMRNRLINAPIERVDDDELALDAWATSDEFGWAKTYDAHYVALARRAKCKLVSLDGRLLRGIARIDIGRFPRDLT